MRRKEGRRYKRRTGGDAVEVILLGRRAAVPHVLARPLPSTFAPCDVANHVIVQVVVVCVAPSWWLHVESRVFALGWPSGEYLVGANAGPMTVRGAGDGVV